ncbi:MAG: mRNA interferase YafQ [Acidobacteriota bacterium]|nr:mRNA interferase YafQ [Acidobacteriota bacterium]
MIPTSRILKKMLKLKTTHRFDKDLIKAIKSGKDLEKIQVIINQLVKQCPLDRKHNDHKLKGGLKDRRECHIEPDWLLIYKIENGTIIFERTGSHSELF